MTRALERTYRLCKDRRLAPASSVKCGRISTVTRYTTWDGDDSVLLTPERHYSALLAAVVAHGTNLGIAAMADSTADLTVRMLQHVSRTCLRDETIRRANAAIVNYHRALDVSRLWGEGHIASSDGQRFGRTRQCAPGGLLSPLLWLLRPRRECVHPPLRSL
jgi:hypothetical protein